MSYKSKLWVGKRNAPRTKSQRYANQVRTNLLRKIVGNRVPRPMPMRRSIKTGEIKCLDQTFLATYNATWVPDAFPQKVLNADSNGAFQAINLIQQGNGISQRIGNKINLKSVRLRFSLDPTTVTTASPTDTRVMLVYDRQPNGLYPSLNDFLNGVSQSNALLNPSGLALCSSNINPNNFERFTVLMDKSITLPSSQASSNFGPTGDGQNSPWWIDEYIKCKGLPVTYKANSAPSVIGDIATGTLFLFCVGENVALGTSWSYRGQARLRYYDA
ncbi:capsid protein [Sewage-associated circular DNA virus-26]|uniref:capsid protein n=1 Tax=Sewage-associated circular DNA virus-26 TaxID=1592093 RepID=UPI00058622A3|nr:capsid protein [Sewage-associated circular DNA virus-26]AJD07546.1 capsid protein [Sewage-associated circular DNA virus-26]